MTHDDTTLTRGQVVAATIQATLDTLSVLITNTPESLLSGIGYIKARALFESADHLAVLIEDRVLVTAYDYDDHVPGMEVEEEKDDVFISVTTFEDGFELDYGTAMTSCEDLGYIEGNAEGVIWREWCVGTDRSQEFMERMFTKDDGVIMWKYVNEKTEGA